MCLKIKALTSVCNANLSNMIYYKNLLLIDDDEDDHEFFSDAVREIDSSIICDCTLNGDLALEELKSGAVSLPDLIILDTNMPRLSGKQILQELKKDARLKTIPVIMYSTFLSERDNEEFLNLGAACYLAKPSKVKDFTTVLNSILTNQWPITTPKIEEER